MAEADNIFESFSEHFTCPICSGTLTASRPPNLNLDNCSCQDAKGTGGDPPGVLGQQPHYPISNAESTQTNASLASVPVQNGVERQQDPNSRGPPRVPEHSLVHNVNDESNRSYSLNRYLHAVDPMERSYHGPWVDDQSDTSWLLHNHLDMARRGSWASSSLERKGRSSIATCTSYRSNSRPSGRSSGCRTSGTGSSARADDCAGVGDWTQMVAAPLYRSHISDEDLGGM